MAIMHTTLIGIVCSDPSFNSDDNGQEMSCHFSIKVKNDNQYFDFYVVVYDKDQISICKKGVAQGSQLLINGMLSVKYHNIFQCSSAGKICSLPIITSDMVLVGKELIILINKKDAELFERKRCSDPFVSNDLKQSELQHTTNSTEELPF